MHTRTWLAALLAAAAYTTGADAKNCSSHGTSIVTQTVTVDSSSAGGKGNMALPVNGAPPRTFTTEIISSTKRKIPVVDSTMSNLPLPTEEPTLADQTESGTKTFDTVVTAPAVPKSEKPDIPANERVTVSTSTAPAGVVHVLPDLPEDVKPNTDGIEVPTVEALSVQDPILDNRIATPTSLLSPLPSKDLPKMASPTATVIEAEEVEDIFAVPVGTKAPPSQIKSRDDHPVSRKGIASDSPVSTNKFYGNFLVGSRKAPTFTHPYSVAWSAGGGPTGSYGLAVSQIEASQRVFGDKTSDGNRPWFINPIGIQSIILSQKELDSSTTLTVRDPTAFSATIELAPKKKPDLKVSFPLVQGMAFVTAEYNGGIPTIQSGVFFRTVTLNKSAPKSGMVKYKIVLEDGRTWLLFAKHSKGNALELDVVNNANLMAKKPFYGIIQVTKNPGNGDMVFNRAAGAYATGLKLSGSVSGKTGTYSFEYETHGEEKGVTELALYALPHHMDSFDQETKDKSHSVKLQTTTKGIATIVLANKWTFVEKNLATDISFAPYKPGKGPVTKVTSAAKEAIRTAALREISQDMGSQSNLDSMYFSGKALGKFAMIINVFQDILGDSDMAGTGTQQLKKAFATFADNKQRYPLVYDKVWGGVVSSASYVTGDSGVDFGNSYYNDHHFHYGYFILAAATLARFDSSWASKNKDFVNTLIRDTGNPVADDKYFPQYRSFDWFHGHSWANGLYESYDGKDQESSSEDMMYAYAVAMWGSVVGDSTVRKRSLLQLAVLSRSLQAYYLYQKNNTIQPKEFIGNKVAGILFENKIDHTTYFGNKIEYIQGIHMIPLLPATLLVRPADFVKEEWDVYFSKGRVDKAEGAWRSILYGSYATIDPAGAWKYFGNSKFDTANLDGGASLTWYRAVTAALALA